jgi:Domain of unknown function (DUF4281)
MEQVFSISSLLVMPFWALMIFAPRWSWTKRIIGSPFISLPAALLYAVLVVPNALSLLPALANPNLAGIQTLLGSPQGATVAWIHFLAFDLFVGRWAYLDSQERGINVFLMAPVLFLVLMFGPLGFAVYLGVRSSAGSRSSEARALQS